MIITISGKSGAGKTTLAKKLAENLNYNFVSVGDLLGKVAQERGITINELINQAKTDKSIHKKMDKKTIELGNKDNLIVEGWIAWHFIPNSKKIFLEVDPNIGAERIFKNQRPDETPCKTPEEMKYSLNSRLQDTNQAFIKCYGINFLDHSNYDLIINTSHLSTEETVKKIISKIKD